MQRWTGPWPGTVVNTEDPDKAGRIRVRVDQVYGAVDEDEKIEDGDLPWARANFPVTGNKSGEFHVPPVGASVTVTFWGGSGEKPIWHGGWFTPDTVPDLAKSSYDPTPKTRIVRTDNGHVFEMRWKKGEEEVHLDSAGGQKIRLVDADKLDGPKIEVFTKNGFKLTIDEKNKKVTIATPGARSITLDDDAKKVTIATAKHTLTLDDNAGKATLDAQGDIEVTATGDITETPQGDFKANATGDAEIDGVNVSLVATALGKLVGAQVNIGPSGGPYFKLMDERLIPLLNIMIATFNGHLHPTIPVISGPPTTTQLPVILDTANTTIAKGG